MASPVKMGLDNLSVTGTEASTMRHTHPGSFSEQANLLRRQFLQDGDLPFTHILTEGVITQALAAVGGWLDRIFSPLITLWVSLARSSVPTSGGPSRRCNPDSSPHTRGPCARE